MGISLECLLSSWVFAPIFLLGSLVLLSTAVLHLLVSGIRCLRYLQHRTERPPQLVFKESAFSRFLLRRVPALREPYCPPAWTRLLDVQTLVSAYWIRVPIGESRVRFERQFLQLKDRGLVALDWALPAEQPYVNHATWSSLKRGQPVLLLLPDAGSDAVHLAEVCREAVQRGLRAVVFNRRGCGGCPLATPRLQAYGDPGDLRQAVKYIRACSSARVTGVGYGTGGDLLLAYLGEFGSSSSMAACAAVSPLYDPEQVLAEGRLRQPYALLNRLGFRRFLNSHSGALGKAVGDWDSVMKAASPQEAERILVGRLCPETGEQHYWEKNSPLRDADDISTPLLCINSKDDPYLSGNHEVIPYEIFRVYPNLLLAVTDSGGHCAFLQDWWPGQQPSWADRLALSFIQATLEFSSQEEKSSKSASR